MITGVIQNSNKTHKRLVSVNPVSHHYEEPGEKPYIKWGCPVCEMVGNRASVPQGTKNCPLCGVSLNWDRKPEVGDTVVIRGIQDPEFVDGSICTVKNVIDEKGELPYVLEKSIGSAVRYLSCYTDAFTILNEVEDE